MEQTNFPGQPAPKRSGTLAALTIIGMIANGIWMLMLLILMAMGADAFSKMGAMPAGASGLIMAILVIGLILLALKLWGCIKMYNMQKGGYILYLIPNILISLIMLLGYIQAPEAIFITIYNTISFVTWVGSIVFMIMLGAEMKKL